MKKARSSELVNENEINSTTSTCTGTNTGIGSKILPKSNGSTTSSSTTKFRSSHQKSSVFSMAGDIRIVDQKMPRKTWALQDRSALSVHLLKANLAEEGCEEAQLDVAKNLMQESTDESAGPSLQRENARKATYWLVRSAEQGNEEATSLLKHRLLSGEGINCQNISDVRSCVITPRNEKLVFKAARRLYDKLSNGEEFITTTQIQEYCSTKEEKGQGQGQGSFEDMLLDPQAQDDVHNTTFTVDNGEDTNVQDVKRSARSNPSQAVYTEDELRRLVKLEAIKLTRNDLLQVATSYNNGEIPHVSIDVKKMQRYDWNLCSLTNAFLLQFLVLSLFMKALTLHTIILVLASFIAVWTAFRLWTWRSKLSIVEEWTAAFKSVLQNNPVDDYTNEKKLTSKQVLPLLATTMVSVGILHILNAPQYIIIASAILTLLAIFRGVVNYQVNWQIGFIIVSTLVSSPIFNPVFQQFILQVDSLKDIISFETINSQLDDFEHLLPSVDFEMAVAVVNLAVIAESYLHNSRTSSSVMIQLAVFVWFFTLISTIAVSTLYSCCVAIVTAIIVGVTFYLLEFNKSVWNILTWIVVALACVILACVTQSVISKVDSLDMNNSDVRINRLTWEEYNQNCHRKAWKTKSVGETQLDCVMKYECAETPTFVTWTGKVSVIKITDIEKTRHNNLLSPPFSIKDVLLEILVNVGHNSGTSDEDSSWPTLLSISSKEKEVMSIVSVLISTTNIIGVDEKLKTVRRLLDLRVNDLIEFHGLLLRGSGGLKPEIGQIETLRCLNCAVSGSKEFYFKNESLLTTTLFGSMGDYLGFQLIVLLNETETAFKNFFKFAIECIKPLSW